MWNNLVVVLLNGLVGLVYGGVGLVHQVVVSVNLVVGVVGGGVERGRIVRPGLLRKKLSRQRVAGVRGGRLRH